MQDNNMDCDSHADVCVEQKRCSLVETLQKMQERELAYRVRDYLNQPELVSSEEAVDAACRKQMIDWMKSIIDHCKFSRSTVSIAVNYMDRFLMTTGWALLDRSAFQLASITCLYMAIKIHEPTVLSVESVMTLTRGAYTSDQIEAMERLILGSIKWLMNPSTPHIFLPYLCELAVTMDSRLSLKTVQELAVLQIENTMNDYETGLIPSSTLALASVFNAIDSMGISSVEQQQAMQNEFRALMNLSDEMSLVDVQERLYEGVLSIEHRSFSKAKKNHRACGSSTDSEYSPRAVSNLRVLAYE